MTHYRAIKFIFEPLRHFSSSHFLSHFYVTWPKLTALGCGFGLPARAGLNSWLSLNHVICLSILHQLPNISHPSWPLETLWISLLFTMSNGQELTEVPEEKVSVVQAALGRRSQPRFDLRGISAVNKAARGAAASPRCPFGGAAPTAPVPIPAPPGCNSCWSLGVYGRGGRESPGPVSGGAMHGVLGGRCSLPAPL